jgi:hypothetical protein
MEARIKNSCKRIASPEINLCQKEKGKITKNSHDNKRRAILRRLDSFPIFTFNTHPLPPFPQIASPCHQCEADVVSTCLGPEEFLKCQRHGRHRRMLNHPYPCLDRGLHPARLPSHLALGRRSRQEHHLLYRDHPES